MLRVVGLVHLADAGRVAAARLGALLVGVGVVSAIIFSKQGMTARDALRATAALPGLRAGLFAAWVLASAPAARALFGTRTTLWLRSLAPPGRFYPAIAGALALLETPWVLLHARGAGPLAGAAALATAAGAHALLAARGLGLVGAVAIVAAILVDPGVGPLLLAGGLALVAGVPAAYHAAAVAPIRARAAVAGPPLVAVALAFVLSAWRGARAAFTRALIVGGAGAAATLLVADNHGLAGGERLRLTLGMAAPCLAAAFGGVVQAVLGAETAAGWLLDATGLSQAARTGARGLALAGVGALAGALYGAAVSGPAGAALTMPWGAALLVALGAAVRRAGARDDVAFMLAAAVAAAFATVAGLA